MTTLPLDISPAVQSALKAGNPVVALESTIITHGMPWPQNLETARAIEATVRDAVVLGLPIAPLCRIDCPGLCAQCGAPLADDPEHHHEEHDPRWAALTALLADEKHDEDKDN